MIICETEHFCIRTSTIYTDPAYPYTCIYVSVTTARYDANSYANYRAYYIDSVSIEPDLVLVAVLVFNTCSSR